VKFSDAKDFTNVISAAQKLIILKNEQIEVA